MNVATRGREREYGDADQIDAKAAEWLSKIDENEFLTYIDIDHADVDAFEQAYDDADQIDAKVAEWLSKIDANEVLTYIDIDQASVDAFEQACATNNPEAIGLVFMAVKRNYAERLAMRDLELVDSHLLSDGAEACRALTTWLKGR